MLPADKFTACDADIQPVDATELPGDPYQMCDFCGKLVAPGGSTPVLERLSGPGRFFCGFCLRQRHNTKSGLDTLVLSFRGVVAYLYYESYVSQRLISFSEIEDVVGDHVRAGLANPLFSYDPASMLWHVDFSRVGATKKKLPFEFVKATLSNVIASLRLSSLIQCVQLPKLESKYVEAIDHFYERRSRPANRRLLIPTLKGCGLADPKNQNWDKHKDFTESDMLVRFH